MNLYDVIHMEIYYFLEEKNMKVDLSTYKRPFKQIVTLQLHVN